MVSSPSNPSPDSAAQQYILTDGGSLHPHLRCGLMFVVSAPSAAAASWSSRKNVQQRLVGPSFVNIRGTFRTKQARSLNGVVKALISAKNLASLLSLTKVGWSHLPRGFSWAARPCLGFTQRVDLTHKINELNVFPGFPPCTVAKTKLSGLSLRCNISDSSKTYFPKLVAGGST